MKILNIGEKLHIIERRYFESDPRRHFIGEIVQLSDTSDSMIRIKGYTWVFDGARAEFIRRQNIRERIIVLSERLIINIMPKEINIDEFKYIRLPDKGLCVTDEKEYYLEISEFASTR